ncbi:MAG: T9SS type A sorting domain-containing protein [Bacteroidetes bacterium]|nr:T9SS type A sorting domain-containing protein [Bacteroidota bacterium]
MATFWYIGKVDQVTGNGITTGSSAKIIICDLLDNNKQLTFTNSTGITSTNTISATGGKLDIRKGKVIETTTAYITGSTGTLYMSPGTLYKIVKGYSSPLPAGPEGATPNNFIPRLLGANYPYVLTGGTIELAGTGTGANAFQTLRGGRNYQALLFSGANTNGTDYKNLSSNADAEISVEVKNGAVVDCIDGGLDPASFTGNGGLLMSDAGSRFRIKNKTNKQPELKGSTVDYNLQNGTVEFYGTGATDQQNMRGNEEGADTKRIVYYNVDINAAAANYSTPPTVLTIAKAGNVDAVESFGIAGTFNVNSPASFRLDETDYIEGAGNVSINSGGGLLYGSPNGIKTTGTGVTDGNIRISGTRTFNQAASYGFVGNGGMSSGSALPTQVVGLYVYKNTAGDTVGLTNPVEVTSKLKFQNGIIKTNANLVNVSNSATTAIEGGNLTGTDKYVQGNLQRNTDGASSYTFPIGHASQNAQGFTIGVTGANNSTIKGFLETNIQTLVQSIAYCDIEKHSGTAGVENAGEGLSGYDGILDRITFNLKSPLQWDVVNPSGGITSYDITVSANGGQDFTPVVSSNALPIRYLMKNGEPGNTGYATGPGLPSFTATGFLACPNGYTLTGMTSFSKFTVDGADQDNTVLPIELIYFDATCDKEGYVDLNWSTASELNNDYYTIERSRDAVSFEQVKEVDAAGNSGNILAYNEKDESPILGTSYYRLKQTDLDGSFSFSKIVRVDCTTGGDESINVFYADGEGIVSTIFINNGERFNFSIYDDLGRIIYEEKRNIGEGFSRNLLNNKDLATGIYFVTAQSENRRVSVKLFVP